MKKFLLSMTALLAAGLGFGFDRASANNRVALVLGNSSYQSATALPNPRNDAKAVAGMLRKLGFDVMEKIDLTRKDMVSAIFEFGERTIGSEAAVFFYAGHGIQMDGRNYLIPVDSDIKSEFELKLGSAIELDTAIDKALSDAKVKIVILDACRDNPFAAQIQRSMAKTRSTTILGQGLAEVRIGTGTIVAYATAPGQTALDGSGANSPFTTALMKHLGEPNQEIQLALTRVRGEVESVTQKRQIPWTNTNLSGFFYLNPTPDSRGLNRAGTAAPKDLGAGRDPASPSTDQIDMEFWRSVRDSRDIDDFRAYLKKFPGGIFADIARGRIERFHIKQEASLPKRQDDVAKKPGSAADHGAKTSDDGRANRSRHDRKKAASAREPARAQGYRGHAERSASPPRASHGGGNYQGLDRQGSHYNDGRTRP